VKALLILGIGIVCSALSFVFIRESSDAAVTLAGWRVMLAALILLPIYWISRRRHGDLNALGVLKRSLIPGIILAVHFIAWVVGARLTPGANASLMVNLMPLVMPFLMFGFYQERLSRRDAIATTLALTGLLILGISDVQINIKHLLGDLICLLSMTVVGHSALNYAMQQLKGQTVTVMNLFQFVVAGLVAWWIYNEVPAPAFYLASALVISGILVIITGTREVPD